MSWQSGFLPVGRKQQMERRLGDETGCFSSKESAGLWWLSDVADVGCALLELSLASGVGLLGFVGCFVLVLKSFNSCLVTAAASWAGIGGSLQGVRGVARRLQRQTNAATATMCKGRWVWGGGGPK